MIEGDLIMLQRFLINSMGTTTMKRSLSVVLLLVVLPLTVAACLWDSDTPASEAKGLSHVVEAITGRFDRNPPLYYEMRMRRAADLVETQPERLKLYDDAGVSCDRLGRGEEAISWMKRKRAQLDTFPESEPERKEHEYRYHANLGTFLVHNWARNGADRGKIEEVEAARDEIAKAIEINPNAHFGREKYQLKALEWIIHPPKIEGVVPHLPNILGWSFDDIYGQDTKPEDAHEAVDGLAGLIVLGNAWESVDIFHALNIALQRDSVGFEPGRSGGRNTLAYLAWFRCRELVDAGKGSMLPDAPKGEALKALMPRPDFVLADLLLDPAYKAHRKAAEEWQAARTAFMMEKLKAGRHPDTDWDFWFGFNPAPAPELPELSVSQSFQNYLAYQQLKGLALLVGLFAISVVSCVALLVVLKRKKPRGVRGTQEPQTQGEMREIAWVADE